MSKILRPGQFDENVLKKPIKHLTGDAKWRDIADLIARWGRRNPDAMQLTIDYAKDLQEGLKDKQHGQMGGGNTAGTRIGVVIHPELMNYIQAFYPDFLDSNEDVAEVKRRFPKFKVPEK